MKKMHLNAPLTVAAGFLGIIPTTIIASVAPTPSVVVDLSAQLQYSPHHNASPGAEALLDVVESSSDNIRTVMVLEHGRIVYDYVRNDIGASDTYNIYSATKSIMSLIIGMLVDEGSLSLDETLGEVFNNSSAWVNVGNADYVRSVTIEEILTMTSGLVDPPVSSESYANVDWEDPTSYVESLGGVHNYGGADLIDSLSYLEVKESSRGEFNYILVSQILGYVVLERTGLTPLALANERIFPLIGIDPDTVEWDENDDGMQHSFSGLRMNPDQMARFGQLFLQRGMAAPDRRVVSENYLEMSLSSQVDLTSLFPGMSFGYLFWKIDGAMMGMGSIDCAQGFGGQAICINDELDRVSVLQIDVGVSDQEFEMTMIRLALSAFSSATSFEGDGYEREKDSGSEANDSAEDVDTNISHVMRLNMVPLLLTTLISVLIAG